MTELIPTEPAEHCGDILDLPAGGDTTECVLRPGHSGSHANEHGMRWRLTTPAPVAHATPSSSKEAEAGFDAIMRLYPRRTLLGRKRWWYDCSRCGTTSGPFADQAATIGDVGQHVAEWHESAPDDTDLTEADIDRMMADGTPVQIVNGPPPTFGAPDPCSGCRYVPCGKCAPAPEPGLREQVAEAIGLHRNGPASDGRGWYRNDEDRAECHAIADAVLAVRDTELAEARETNQRLNYRAQALESELAAYRRAVGQWEISERGTYIPLNSLRTIGKAAGKDILGSVRHLAHFERVEQAEAANEQLQTDLAARDAAIARVHAELIRLCSEPHPSHGHLCPDDVRRTILNALDQLQEEA